MTRAALDALLANASPTVKASGRTALGESYENKPHSQISDSKPFKRQAPLEVDCEAQTPGSERIALRFTLRRVRLLDPCAKYGSCKALIDGLRYAGILHNDREEDITLEVAQKKVAHFKDEETLIEIYIPNS
jgi:hypothetical protein